MREGELLKDFIDKKRQSKTSLATALGITRTTLYQYFDSEELEAETKKKFEDYYKEKIFTEEVQKTYRQQRLEKKLALPATIVNNASEGVPVYDVPIDASFIERYRDEAFNPLYHLNIPKLRNCDFGAIVSGSSMYPIIKSGSIAMCRVVDNLDYIDPGEMYFISTVNGFETVKYVQPGDTDDELLLIPHNEKIRSTTIKKSMIIRVCIVEAWLSFR